MIILTGAAGFIGSCMVAELNRQGRTDLVLVDDFSRPKKRPNYREKAYLKKVNRDRFFEWLQGREGEVEAIVHLGARTDTAEQDVALFDRLNLNYSQAIWRACMLHGIPLIYASSAATYGGGEHGFSDAHGLTPRLKPLNPYGRSKHSFDQWVLQQHEEPPFWAGLRFFNVYGPNEYHKKRMASVIFHAYGQIKKTGGLKLFRSHNPEFSDGEQARDFIYVRDVVRVISWLLASQSQSGIYNLGTGQARTFLDLGRAVFAAMGIEPEISFIDTPEDIRATYQYFTEADMNKLRTAGYDRPFTSLEEGIADYVENYLASSAIW